MSDTIGETATSADTILFRPSKKRKIYRQRAEDNEIPEQQAASLTQGVSSTQLPTRIPLSDTVEDTAEDVEGTRVSMAEILRLRKLRKQRAGGVEFRADTLTKDDFTSLTLVEDGMDEEGAEPTEVEATGVVRRFAPQTGTVGDVNKHMMAYIDAELAKRRSEGLATNSTSLNDPAAQERQRAADGDGTKSGKDVQRQPAALGKLLEIDLGSEARAKNVERTAQARRRMDGEEIEEEEPGAGQRKPRLGKDGKPWRGRKRRTSDDIKRDKLVEEVLRENRRNIATSDDWKYVTNTSAVDMYDESDSVARINDDQAADDRIAEEFRREFMDAVSARQRKKPAPPPPTRIGGKKEEVQPTGPKLGGSRSARAAMREQQLKAGKK